MLAMTISAAMLLINCTPIADLDPQSDSTLTRAGDVLRWTANRGGKLKFISFFFNSRDRRALNDLDPFLFAGRFVNLFDYNSAFDIGVGFGDPFDSSADFKTNFFCFPGSDRGRDQAG